MIFKQKTLLAFIWACCATCLVGGAEQQEILGNFINPGAVKEVLAGKRRVANAAWWGFDKEDSTAALQGAIDSDASKVIVPYMGSEWVVRPIKLNSNQEIFFEPGVVVVAKKGEFRGKNDCLFSAVGKKNIVLRGYGATLKMQKDDYTNTKLYEKSEWRMGIALYGCSNIKLYGLTIKDTGGDGIYVGAHGDIACSDIQIKDCICDNNYRQGISIISAENLLIENCVFKNTNGTAPSAGIDIEPNNERDKLVNVVVSNCIFENNSGPGIQVYLRKLSASSEDVSVLFVNCYVNKCGGAGLLISAIKDDGPQGLIEFRNCTVETTEAAGIYVYDKSANRAKLRFSNCKLQNVGKIINYSPISLSLERPESTLRFGGIEFVNCYVYDERNRPFMKSSRLKGGIYSIKGDISVYNSHGVRMDLGEKAELDDLRITNYHK